MEQIQFYLLSILYAILYCPSQRKLHVYGNLASWMMVQAPPTTASAPPTTASLFCFYYNDALEMTDRIGPSIAAYFRQVGRSRLWPSSRPVCCSTATVTTPTRWGASSQPLASPGQNRGSSTPRGTTPRVSASCA